jgi:N utilization substance protein A
MRSGYNSLMALPGVGVSLADALYEKGFFSAEEISHSTVEDLTQQIRDIDEQTATTLIEAAEEAVLQAEAEQSAETQNEDTTQELPEEIPNTEAEVVSPAEQEEESDKE